MGIAVKEHKIYENDFEEGMFFARGFIAEYGIDNAIDYFNENYPAVRNLKMNEYYFMRGYLKALSDS